MVEYFWGEKHKYAIVITSRNCSFVELPFTPSDDGLIDAFMHNIERDKGKSMDREVYAYQAYRLFEILIKPIAEDLPGRLIIIPDGPLGRIPFDGLLVEAPNREQNRYSFLVERYTTSISFSAGLMLDLPKRTAIATKEYLGMAPVEYKGTQSRLSFLPNSLNEVSLASDIFQGDTILYDSAEKSTFIEKGFLYRILHLATHAGADDSGKELPWISFRSSAMKLREIYNMKNLAAELLILSGCQTNKGEVRYGEGIMSIARAFSYKKCYSMMTTLWDAAQVSVPDIVIEYCKLIKQGYAKDIALNMAKRKYMAESQNINPFFWAGIVQLGDISPLYSIDSHSSNTYYYLFFLFLGALIATYIIHSRFYRK